MHARRVLQEHTCVEAGGGDAYLPLLFFISLSHGTCLSLSAERRAHGDGLVYQAT